MEGWLLLPSGSLLWDVVVHSWAPSCIGEDTAFFTVALNCTGWLLFFLCVLSYMLESLCGPGVVLVDMIHVDVWLNMCNLIMELSIMLNSLHCLVIVKHKLKRRGTGKFNILLIKCFWKQWILLFVTSTAVNFTIFPIYSQETE